MANAISFEDNEIFGKHIVAKCDIETGKIVMVVDAFASIEYLSSVQEKCFECGKTKNADAFSCSHCIDVWFCSPKCSFSTAHQSKCNKIFNRHDSREVRLVTEMIKITFETTKKSRKIVSQNIRVMVKYWIWNAKWKMSICPWQNVFAKFWWHCQISKLLVQRIQQILNELCSTWLIVICRQSK